MTLPGCHHRHLVGQPFGLLDVVGRHQDRRPARFQVADQRPELGAGSAGRGRPSARRAGPGCGSWTRPRASSRRRRIPPESFSTASPAAVGEAGDPERAGRPRRGDVARPGRGARRRRGSSSTRDVDVEVVELRDDAHLAGAPASTRPGSSIAEHAQRCPASATAWPVSSRIVVDLPAPLGPSRPRQMPSGTSRSRPSTAAIVAEAP